MAIVWVEQQDLLNVFRADSIKRVWIGEDRSEAILGIHADGLSPVVATKTVDFESESYSRERVLEEAGKLREEFLGALHRFESATDYDHAIMAYGVNWGPVAAPAN